MLNIFSLIMNLISSLDIFSALIILGVINILIHRFLYKFDTLKYISNTICIHSLFVISLLCSFMEADVFIDIINISKIGNINSYEKTISISPLTSRYLNNFIRYFNIPIFIDKLGNDQTSFGDRNPDGSINNNIIIHFKEDSSITYITNVRNKELVFFDIKDKFSIIKQPLSIKCLRLNENNIEIINPIYGFINVLTDNSFSTSKNLDYEVKYFKNDNFYNIKDVSPNLPEHVHSFMSSSTYSDVGELNFYFI